MENPPRAVYPMRLVIKLTGLTSDTIRAWERRYKAIEPERSRGNTRQFSAEDVRRLTLLKEATDLGHSISSVAALPTLELSRLVAESRPQLGPGEGSVMDRGRVVPLSRISESYLGAVTRFDTRRGLQILRSAAERLDPHDFVFTVAVPIIQEVGARWSHGDLGVAHEHIVSSQMSALLANLPIPPSTKDGAPKMFLSAPPGHRHELGILVGGILAALRGVETVFLGVDLPWQELDWAVQMARPAVLTLSVVRDLTPSERDSLEVAIARLSEKVEVWMGCPADHALARSRLEARLFHSYAQFDAAVRNIDTRHS